jgi:hypothetical protein
LMLALAVSQPPAVWEAAVLAALLVQLQTAQPLAGAPKKE